MRLEGFWEQRREPLSEHGDLWMGWGVSSTGGQSDQRLQGDVRSPSRSIEPHLTTASAASPLAPFPTGWLIALVALLGTVALVLLFVFAPQLVPDPGDEAATLAARTTGIATLRAATLAAGVGLAAILTLMLGARTARTAEYNAQLVRQAQQDARLEAERRDVTTRESLELTRRAQQDAREDAERRDATTRESLELTRLSLTQTRAGQLTEAYTAAIELLGTRTTGSAPGAESAASQTAVMNQLGGVYALERLARAESDTYRTTVVEVLSAFVRARSGLRGREIAGAAFQSYYDDEGELLDLEPPLPDHDAALLAAVAVLGRLADSVGADPAGQEEPVAFDRDRRDYLALVQGTALGADLRGTNLREIDLDGADLRGAKFRGSDLRGATMRRADLRFADLSECDLTRVRFDAALLGGVMFDNSWLIDARLDAIRAGPAAAPHERTRFVEAHLDRAVFDAADLRGARLGHAQGLSPDQLELAFGNRHTSVPAGVRPPGAWDRTHFVG